MKTALLISYFFPPMITAGSYRVAAFAKHLPSYGFQPVVLTTELNRFSWGGTLDDFPEPGYPIYRIPGLQMGTLMSRLFNDRIAGYGQTRQAFRGPNANPVKKILGIAYDEVLTFPDPQWPWYVLGRQQALRVARKVRPDIVLSSALPFSSHLLAAYIKKKLNVPWVADYRDLWSMSHFTSQSRISINFRKKIEKHVLMHADALTTVSAPLSANLGKLSTTAVQVVTNGFDVDETASHPIQLPAEWEACRLNILYTGMSYPGYQDLQPLIKALARLHTSGRINPGQILVWFFGPNNEVFTPLIKEYALEAYFKIRGSVSHPESMALQMNADLLLFLEWTDLRHKGIFTTKFFEYLGAGKPILGIGPRGGVVDDALKTTDAGIMASDPAEIAGQLHFYLNHGFFPNQTKPYRPDFEKLKKYSRDYQTGILARLMEKTVNGTSPIV